MSTADDARKAEIARLRLDVERLDRWKGEALKVLSGWERVHDALGKPATPGQLKSEAALGAVVSLIERDNTLALDALESASHARRERDKALAEVERLRGAATDIERLSDTYTVEGTALVMQRMIEVKRQRDEARAALVVERSLTSQAYQLGVRDAQQVVAGEDTIDWARNASGSNMSLAWLIGGMDDLVDDEGDIADRLKAGL